MSGILLTLNAGSSSLKFAVFETGSASEIAEIRGQIANIGIAPTFSAKDAAGNTLDAGALAALDADAGHDRLIGPLLDWIGTRTGNRPLDAIGHRVVHGGERFRQPTLVDPSVLAVLDTLIPLAPLHQPHNVAAIRAAMTWRPGLPQVACFDTSFHRTQDRLANLYALPRDLSDEGIVRYGFHGLSYAHIARVLPKHLGPRAEGRVIVAHIGAGASMCAMKDRRCVATSMGFTALEGMMMAKRCGNLDPGVVLYLMQAKGMDADAIQSLLYHRSGLLGVSGISDSMQVLEASDDPHAREAVALFCHRAASVLAGLVPSIGGLDALVFTAGIGENSASVRKAICDRLGWLGIRLDDAANEAGSTRIDAASAPVSVLVVPTNEETVVADGCRSLLC